MQKIIYKYRNLIWLIILCIGQYSCSLKYYGKEKRGDMTAHWLKYDMPHYYRKTQLYRTSYKKPYKQYYQNNYKISPKMFTPTMPNNYNNIKYSAPKNYFKSQKPASFYTFPPKNIYDIPQTYKETLSPQTYKKNN